MYVCGWILLVMSVYLLQCEMFRHLFRPLVQIIIQKSFYSIIITRWRHLTPYYPSNPYFTECILFCLINLMHLVEIKLCIDCVNIQLQSVGGIVYYTECLNISWDLQYGPVC